MTVQTADDGTAQLASVHSVLRVQIPDTADRRGAASGGVTCWWDLGHWHAAADLSMLVGIKCYSVVWPW
jgi:asparagine N-glycosylation enzyme membrane subunit Stt3